MVEYIKVEQKAWLLEYEEKYGSNTMANLTRLCNRFALRHGFVRKCATSTKMSAEELAGYVRSNADTFWKLHAAKDASLVLNCDETGICYDMPPKKILTMKRTPADIDAIEKNSGRIRECVKAAFVKAMPKPAS